MASSSEALPSEPSTELPHEVVGNVEGTLAPSAMEVKKALASIDEEEEQSLQTNGDPPSETVAGSSGPGGEDSVETLKHAAELFEKGSKAIEDGDLVDAVDCLSRALEIRVAHYGELAPECAISYYKYGCALLYKAQEEADPLVDVPKNTPRITEKDKTLTSVEDGGSSKASINDANKDTSNNEEVEEEVCSDKDEEDEEDGNDGSDGDGEGQAEADEDESDLDLAWKMLELARATVEKKSPEDTMETVNILAALGEVSAEREDIDTSLNDYLKALSILERLVEPDNRRLVELNFRICLVLEVGSKTEEAIPYCQKAISLCKSRLQRLREDAAANSNGMAEKNVNPVPGSDKSDDKSSSSDDPSILQKNDIEVFSGILSELERKLEDLQQAMSTPTPDISEVLKMMIASKSGSSSNTEANPCNREVGSLSSNSSRVGVIDSGGFDSPTISTAATNVVTHLGVVGRGIKRATLTPSSAAGGGGGGGGAEPPRKKSLLDTSAEKDGSSVSEVTDSSSAQENP